MNVLIDAFIINFFCVFGLVFVFNKYMWLEYVPGYKALISWCLKG